MTVALETKLTAATSLAQTQELIMTIFSCVGYLRDLFPDSSFQDHKVSGMSLKRFKRGGDGKSDELLKWIEAGCFDALQKKYLKSVILTVLADTSSPNNVLETYTLKVSYPDSAIHQNIDAASAGLAQLSLSRNEESVLAVEAKPGAFKESVSKILRSLCVMTQTLKSLPSTKYLSMKLAYYDEVTPPDYEPPGFIAAEFDIDHLFQGPTSKYSFGRAVTAYHGIGLSMETICDDEASAAIARPKSTKSESQSLNYSQAHSATAAANNTINAQDGLNFDESIRIASQTAQPPNSPPQFPQSQPVATILPASLNTSNSEKGNIMDLPASQQLMQQVLCSCGINTKDLEMLKCDSCHKWQHAICAGYISSRDRRLELDSSYVCYYCQFCEQRKTLEFLKKLSLFRKGLAMISAQGFRSLTEFSQKMGFGAKMCRRITMMMEKEKFLLPKGRSYSVAKKDDGIKERIKFYFNLNLEIHEEFREARKLDQQKTKEKLKISNELIKQEENVNDIDDVFESEKPIAVKVEQEAQEKQEKENILTSPKTPIPSKTNRSLRTPPASNSSLKKRKISIPSVKITCYTNGGSN